MFYFCRLGNRKSLPNQADSKYLLVLVVPSLCELTRDYGNSHLNLYLPYPVDHEKGSAKFDVDTCTLIVTLPIIRSDFPFWITVLVTTKH